MNLGPHESENAIEHLSGVAAVSNVEIGDAMTAV